MDVDFEITDPEGYEKLFYELDLENAHVDDLEEDLEITIAFDMEVEMDIAVFQCPFQEYSSCDYTITDLVSFEGDIQLVRSAAAAHVVVTHGGA